LKMQMDATVAVAVSNLRYHLTSPFVTLPSENRVTVTEIVFCSPASV